MSAFNWVEFEATCPSCKLSNVIRSQVHTCSDFDGDDSGRFHDKVYHLGEKMAWWPSSDIRYREWLESNLRLGQEGTVSGTECCYSQCSSCGAALFVVLRFNELIPVKAELVGKEENWPSNYLK